MKTFLICIFTVIVFITSLNIFNYAVAEESKQDPITPEQSQASKNIGIVIATYMNSNDSYQPIGQVIAFGTQSFPQPYDRRYSHLQQINIAADRKLLQEYSWCKEHECAIGKIIEKTLANQGYNVITKNSSPDIKDPRTYYLHQKQVERKQKNEPTNITSDLTLVEKKQYPLTLQFITYYAVIKNTANNDFSDVNVFGIGKYRSQGTFYISVAMQIDVLNSINGEVIDRIKLQKEYSNKDHYNLTVYQHFANFEITEDTRAANVDKLIALFYEDLIKIFSSYKYDEAYRLISNK